MRISRKILFIMTLSMGFVCPVYGNCHPDDDVVCEGYTENGCYIVGVSGIGKDVSAALDSAKRSAVRQVIFNGLKACPGTVSHKPMLCVTDDGQISYFKSFFANDGRYLDFVDPIPGVSPVPVRIKGGYKVKASLVVKKDELRRSLEEDHILSTLSEGF